ncbi:CpsB/CapC family capsule biosynthesis tyrosine phosphatase [Eisenbergiella tayi]|uniref:CpsB/CapC family capsule biosynthesis tyrosine phosphatase n=1 Tax=Eisenbergiella tayi TaxID=1432052 RepID=UPI003A7F1BE5
MSGWIDIHSHVLPLVDDGAESVEMALLMLRTAAEEGIEKNHTHPSSKSRPKVCHTGGNSASNERTAGISRERTHSGAVISGK